MKRKFIMLLGLTLCAGMLFAGCGSKEESQPAEVEEEPAEEEDVPDRSIGEETDDAFTVDITNEVGQDITGIQVKHADEETWSENIIGSGEEILADETVRFYYTPTAAAEDAASNDASGENAAQNTESTAEAADAGESGTSEDTGLLAGNLDLKDSYDVQLTLADGQIFQLTGFAFDDMEAAAIKFEDGVVFIEYESLESSETVSTKEQELGLKQQREEAAAAEAAAAQAAAEAQAAQEAAAAQAAQEAAAAQAAQEAAAAQAASEPVYEEPAPTYEESAEPAPEQTTEGCLQ